MKWLIVSLILCLGLTTPNQDDKQIELHIHVVTADGDPVDKFLVSAMVLKQTTFGITDKEGFTLIPVKIDNDVSTVQLFPFGFKNVSDLHQSERRELSNRKQEIGKIWHIPREIIIPVEGDAEQIDVEIKLIPPFSVSGRTVGPEGTPIRAIILGDTHIALSTSKKDGSFVLNGLAKGKEQYIYFRNPPHIFRYHITQEESQADCDLGDIELEIEEPFVLVSTDMVKAHEYGRTAGTPFGIMLIDVEGKYASTTRPPVMGLSLDKYKLKVPPGSYYVVPGYFTVEPYQTFVWDHAESQKEWDGKHPLLRVEITEDEATHSLSVDLMDLYTKLMEDMVSKEKSDCD